MYRMLNYVQYRYVFLNVLTKIQTYSVILLHVCVYFLLCVSISLVQAEQSRRVVISDLDIISFQEMNKFMWSVSVSTVNVDPF